MTDWRLPENRREAFMRQYLVHLRYQCHPGCVYFLLPALASAYDLAADDQKAWLVWLNGNTQNPVTTELLVRASDGNPDNWEDAVSFWNDHFKDLQWDTDRRHQKSRFGEATEKWIRGWEAGPGWLGHSSWDSLWKYSLSQPYMGRLSAWSMAEYARIMWGTAIPTPDTLLLKDRDGSRSHRDGITILRGAPIAAAYWDWGTWDLLSPYSITELEDFGRSLQEEAASRIVKLDQPSRLLDTNMFTLESALCTWKSWHKPNRRYPGVYADMHWNRILWAQERWGDEFTVQKDARARALPDCLRKELGPDANWAQLRQEDQNQYLETGVPARLGNFYKDMVA